MRIGMIAGSAGGARELEQRLQLARALVRIGAEVRVFAWRAKDAGALSCGSGIEVLALDPGVPDAAGLQLEAAFDATAIDVLLALPDAGELAVALRKGIPSLATRDHVLGTDASTRHRAPLCGRRAELRRWMEVASDREADFAARLESLELERTQIVVGFGADSGSKTRRELVRDAGSLESPRCAVWLCAAASATSLSGGPWIEGPRVSAAGERHLLACADLAVIDSDRPVAHDGLWLDAMAHGVVPLFCDAGARAELEPALAPFVGDGVVDALTLEEGSTGAAAIGSRVAAWLLEGTSSCGTLLQEIARTRFDWSVRAPRIARRCELALREVSAAT